MIPTRQSKSFRPIRNTSRSTLTAPSQSSLSSRDRPGGSRGRVTAWDPAIGKAKADRGGYVARRRKHGRIDPRFPLLGFVLRVADHTDQPVGHVARRRDILGRVLFRFLRVGLAGFFVFGAGVGLLGLGRLEVDSRQRVFVRGKLDRRQPIDELVGVGRRPELLEREDANTLFPILCEATPVRMDLTHSGWSDIFFLGMDFPEGARVLNISIDLAVRTGSTPAPPRPPVEVYFRVIDRPVLRLASVDLGAAGARRTSFVPDTTKTFSPYAGQQFNFAPYNYLQRPDTRYTFGAVGHSKKVTAVPGWPVWLPK